MNLMDQLQEKIDEMKSLDKRIEELNQERIEWCRDNAQEFKKLYPKKNQILKIKDNDEVCGTLGKEGVYYLKVKNARFTPHLDFGWHRLFKSLQVRGRILDSNFKPIERYLYGDIEVEVKNLELVDLVKTTFIYVMIDKNTGFYKIGRSVNPKARESTLQSEKPTIEMLFNKKGTNDDERALHKMFAKKRIRGEWFDLSGSDINKIKSYFGEGVE